MKFKEVGEKKKKAYGIVSGILIVIFMVMLWAFPGQATRLRDRVVEHTLSNGMKVLVMERHQSPIVSLYIRFRVGMVEDKGVGMAHLLEHMLFKGTETIGTKNFKEEKKLLTQIDRVGSSLDKERQKGESADQKVIHQLEEELIILQEQAGQYVIKDEMNLLYSENGAVGFNASTGADLTTYNGNFIPKGR